jgi:uncharacterized protein YbaR (Trm112 family)
MIFDLAVFCRNGYHPPLPIFPLIDGIENHHPTMTSTIYCHHCDEHYHADEVDETRCVQIKYLADCGTIKTDWRVACPTCDEPLEFDHQHAAVSERAA